MRLKLEVVFRLLTYIYILKGLKDNPLYIYVEMEGLEMNEALTKMVMKALFDETLIKTKLFYPYASYRESILIHLTPFEEQAEDNKGWSMFGSGEGGDLIFDPLEEELTKRAEPILKKYRTSFIKEYEMSNWEESGEGGENGYINLMLDTIATEIFTTNKDFQLNFNNILLQLEEDYKKEVLEKIACEKIKRNKLFILGLSMKVSMRDCGELIECY
jgi:hypothetical protein